MRLTRGRIGLLAAASVFLVAVVVGYPQLNRQIVHDGWGWARSHRCRSVAWHPGTAGSLVQPESRPVKPQAVGTMLLSILFAAECPLP